MDNQNNRYKGLIFDLDGTLVDTVADITDALNDTLIEYRKAPATHEDTMGWIGHGLGALIYNALGDELQTNEQKEEAHQKILKNYKKRWTNKAHIYPGALELVTYCNEHQIPIAVTSNKSDDGAKFIITSLFPETDFIAIEGLKSGMDRKPDPKLTNSVIHLMNLEPESILYIGDSETDYKTAQNCNTHSVLVDYGYGNQDILKSKKDAYHIHNLIEVIELLQ